jgi:hypothetical protein
VPQVVQPDPPLAGVEDETTQVDPGERDDREPPPDEPGWDWRGLVIVAVAAGVPLLVIATPLLVILGLKARRTRRRQQTADHARRLALGWQQVLDQAADLGIVLPPAATRHQAARVLSDTFDPDRLGDLAGRADRATFAPVPPGPGEADAYWAEVGQVLAATRRALPWRRYLAARLRFTSLRRHPRPTVDPEELV